MGLFDPADVNLQKRLLPNVAGRGEKVREVARREGSELGLHHRRELESVAFTAWLQSQIADHGFSSILGPTATPAHLAAAMDQARRIGEHFTGEQAAAFDRTVRHIRSKPDQFEPRETT